MRYERDIELTASILKEDPTTQKAKKKKEKSNTDFYKTTQNVCKFSLDLLCLFL